MSELELSATAKSLLRAAKSDVPTALARGKIWHGIATTAHVAGVGGVAGVASGTKLLAIGTLFGSAVTIGLALTMLHVGPVTPSPAPTVVAGVAPARAPARRPEIVAETPEPPAIPPAVATVGTVARASGSVALGDPRTKIVARGELVASAKSKLPPQAPEAPSALAPAMEAAPAREPSASDTSRPARMEARSYGGAGGGHSPASAAQATEDALMREASLIAEARGALARGDAASAMRAIRAAQALPARQLVPESLSLESQVLRALGRGQEATGASDKLKAEFPEHALAR